MRQLKSLPWSRSSIGLLAGRLFMASVLLFCMVFEGLGQSATIDSLKEELSKANRDTIAVSIYNELAGNSYSSNPQDAIHYGELANQLADSLNYQPGKALALKNIGLGYYFQQDWVKVLTNWQESLKVYESLNDKPGISNLTNNLGSIYFNQGDDAKALEYWLRSLQIAEEIDDKYRIASASVNVSLVYVNMEKFPIALSYSLRSLRLSEEIQDQEAIGFALVNTGEIYFKTEHYDSALYFFDRSVVAFEGTVHVPYSLIYIGKVYTEKGEYEEAVNYLNQGLRIAQDFNENLLIAQVLLGLGDTYQASGNYLRALQMHLEAEKVAKEIGATYELKDIYSGLSSSYSNLGNFEKAFEYQTAFAQLKDTIYNLETSDKVRGLQFGYEIDKKQNEIDLLEAERQIKQLEARRQSAISWGIGIVGVMVLLFAVVLYRRYKFINRTKKVIEMEKGRSDKLLLNILPSETAEELKSKGEADARLYDSVSILFTDFKGFTSISANLTPRELVKEIHECFKMFDIITSRYGIEKIKTIGDAYMAAGGLPKKNATHALDVVRAAVDIRNYMLELKAKRMAEGRTYFEIRLGIHTGPVVAGIVGIKKFAYDIWGDTVNIASRMESNSEAGKINISESTYELIKDEFICEYRGEIEAKNRGKLKMYFVEADTEVRPEYKDLDEIQVDQLILQSE